MYYDSGSNKAITFSLTSVSGAVVGGTGEGVYSNTFNCQEDIQGNSIKVTVSGYYDWGEFGNDHFTLSIVEK